MYRDKTTSNEEVLEKDGSVSIHYEKHWITLNSTALAIPVNMKLINSFFILKFQLI